MPCFFSETNNKVIDAWFLDMVLPCKFIYNSTCRSPVSCSGEPTATCLCVYLAASGLNPIGGALLHLLPGRATGAATAAGDQPPPPGRRAGAPPATRAPRCRTPLAAAQIGRSPQAAVVTGARTRIRSRQGTSSSLELETDEERRG